MLRRLGVLALILAALQAESRAGGPLKVGVFAVDASPPIGSPLAYDPTKGVVHPLSCRGVVLIGDGEPIVLCAVDWIGIGNDGQAEFRAALAKAAGTTAGRVVVHTLHQHDAPHCDFSADRLLAAQGLNREVFDADFARAVIARAAAAAREATAKARPVTHLGLGRSDVEKVASNRRILGADGKVEHVRYSACPDPAIRAQPVGTIDPALRAISLWDGDTPVVVLTYYATHPQSYYRTGLANPDFPGIARDRRQEVTGVPHIHFDGAGGNIGAGKYNDGAPANRQVLAGRVAEAMARAWEASTKAPITAAGLGWESLPVALPPAAHLDEGKLLATLQDQAATVKERAKAANDLAWLRRCRAGESIDVACLRLGNARVLHLPGELFVEYQLAAQAMRPDLFVGLAAYGDYAPGYIGTEVAYSQGGYETRPSSSLVAPGVERVLTDVIRRLLLVPSPLPAQDRDAKVRDDRKAFGASRDWIYNDLGEGVRAARESGKPLLVVFRCIPCEACQEFDDDVARRDPAIRDLLDQFACVRIVQANTIDLTRFQHDFDQSFAAYLMNPDLTIYGRFGTRSARPEQEDISLEGLRKAMEAALRMHRDYPAIKPSLAGKQVRPGRYRTPRDYPSLAGRYGEAIDYEGKTARSCMHCHQVREAERLVYRTAREPIPDEVLFPYPDPAVLGLKLDPEAMARVERVAPGSIAEVAGLKVGDEIATLAGQPLLSIADLQWVLHNAPARAKLPARAMRGGQAIDLTLDLPDGWRSGDISWRATTWDLRRMALGGLRLEELTAEQRAAARLAEGVLALRVRHLGAYGEHAVAKRAGVLQGDILTSFDGRAGRMSESELLAYALQAKRPGDVVVVTVLRDGEPKTLRFALQ